MQSETSLFVPVIISSAVFAALITSITNMIISLLNNRRLKIIEKQKKSGEIDKYRYSRLYEMLLNWHQYTSEFKGESTEETAVRRLANEFLDNAGRYDIVRPLLDKQYIMELDEIRKKGNALANELVRFGQDKEEKSKEENMDDYQEIKMRYFKIGIEFADKLKKVINEQLEELLIQQ